MRMWLWLLLPLACSRVEEPGDPGQDAGIVANRPDGGATWTEPATIDSAPGAGLDLTATVDPSGHAAAAYFRETSRGRFQLVLAREGDDGQWGLETVAIPSGASDLGSVPELTGHYGLALAFDPQGRPALAFLGGGSANNKPMGDGRWTNFDTGEPLPSSAIVMRKTGSGWVSRTMAATSRDIVSTGFAVDDTGVVTGLWAALTFDPAGVMHAFFRDIHFGSDDSATRVANLEYVREDSSGTRTAGELVAGGRGDPMQLAGAATYSRAVVAGGHPAVSFALSPDTTDGVQQVWFARRTNSGEWDKVMVSSATGATGHGPAIAVDHAGHLAIAFYDAIQQDLVVARSDDGSSWSTGTWEALGDTGRHPAAAFDARGRLGVLYGFCRSPVEPAGRCSASQALRFRLDEQDYERVSNVVPDAAALVADPQGRFLAIFRDPLGGVKVATRTP